LLILDSFDGANETQTLAQISRQMRIPKATALRHLLALEQAGYVVANAARDSYTLGSKPLTLAQRYLSQFSVLKQVRPIIAELAHKTGETAHFGVLEGCEVVYLEIAESPQRVRIYVQRGDRLPAHAVAAGKAILARGSDEAVEQFLRRAKLTRLTNATISDARAFRDELALTRAKGYGVNRGEWIEEIVGISCAVIGHDGEPLGALGVAGLGTRLQEAKLGSVGKIVCEHADRLSRLVGGHANAEPGRSKRAAAAGGRR
jgi:DNA-binding IclR family transcriptional regulator